MDLNTESLGYICKIDAQMLLDCKQSYQSMIPTQRNIYAKVKQNILQAGALILLPKLKMECMIAQLEEGNKQRRLLTFSLTSGVLLIKKRQRQ